MTVSIEGSDNIFATNTDAVSDAIFVVSPRLAINSGWGRNALRFLGEADLNRYASHSDQDSDAFLVSGGGTVDVHDGLVADADASFARVLIPRTADAYARASLIPLLYDQTALVLRTTQTFNRLTLSTRGEFDNLEFSAGKGPAGGVLDESFQNRRSVFGRVRTDYAYSGAVAPFLEETVVGDWLNSKFKTQFQTQTLLGVNWDVTHLITAEIAVGYLTSAYGGTPSPPAVGNFSERVKVEYFPTQLVTVTMNGEDAVVASGIPTSPAYHTNALSMTIDYELLRNLIISGQVANEWNNYRVIDRHDEDFGTKLSARYKLNRGVSISVDYNHLQRNSSGAQAGVRFVENVAAFSVTFQK